MRSGARQSKPSPRAGRANCQLDHAVAPGPDPCRKRTFSSFPSPARFRKVSKAPVSIFLSTVSDIVLPLVEASQHFSQSGRSYIDVVEGNEPPVHTG